MVAAFFFILIVVCACFGGRSIQTDRCDWLLRYVPCFFCELIETLFVFWGGCVRGGVGGWCGRGGMGMGSQQQQGAKGDLAARFCCGVRDWRVDAGGIGLDGMG